MEMPIKQIRDPRGTHFVTPETSGESRASNKLKYPTQESYGHRVSAVLNCSMYSNVGWDSSGLTGEFSLASDDLNREPLEITSGALQTEAKQKCSTLGERRMKTQGSRMELTDMKRRAIKSRRWDSFRSPMELRYTRI